MSPPTITFSPTAAFFVTLTFSACSPSIADPLPDATDRAPMGRGDALQDLAIVATSSSPSQMPNADLPPPRLRAEVAKLHTTAALALDRDASAA